MKSPKYKWITCYKGHSSNRLYLMPSERLLPYDAKNPYTTLCESNNYTGLVRYEEKPATVLHVLYVKLAQRISPFTTPIMDWYKLRN